MLRRLNGSPDCLQFRNTRHLQYTTEYHYNELYWNRTFFGNLNKLFTFISLHCNYFCVLMKQEIKQRVVLMYVPCILCSLLSRQANTQYISCAVCYPDKQIHNIYLVKFVIQTSKYTIYILWSLLSRQTNTLYAFCAVCYPDKQMHYIYIVQFVIQTNTLYVSCAVCYPDKQMHYIYLVQFVIQTSEYIIYILYSLLSRQTNTQYISCAVCYPDKQIHYIYNGVLRIYKILLIYLFFY
jgi:predicted amidohydrolase